MPTLFRMHRPAWVSGTQLTEFSRLFIDIRTAMLMVRILLSPPRIKYLIYLTYLSADGWEFLRTFRGFATCTASAPFGQRRFSSTSKALMATRLICAFVVVRQSLAPMQKFRRASKTQNEIYLQSPFSACSCRKSYRALIRAPRRG